MASSASHQQNTFDFLRNWKSSDSSSSPSDGLVWALRMDHDDKTPKPENGVATGDASSNAISRSAQPRRRKNPTRKGSLVDDGCDSEDDSLVLATNLQNMLLCGGAPEHRVVLPQLPGPSNSRDGNHGTELTNVSVDSVEGEDLRMAPAMVQLERMDSLDSLVIHRQRLQQKGVHGKGGGKRRGPSRRHPKKSSAAQPKVLRVPSE